MAVFKACDGKCIITGCSSGHVIDAAHRPGRSWEAGHNTAGDGWMLRADIHRALDAGLIDIAEDGTLTRCDSSVAYIAETYARHTRSRLAERSQLLACAGGIVDIVIWSVPRPVPPSEHGFKYRLVFVRAGLRLVGYDKERAKGDPRHRGDIEKPYKFKDVPTLLEDFMRDVEASK